MTYSLVFFSRAQVKKNIVQGRIPNLYIAEPGYGDTIESAHDDRKSLVLSTAFNVEVSRVPLHRL